jgi:hypothetical protein
VGLTPTRTRESRSGRRGDRRISTQSPRRRAPLVVSAKRCARGSLVSLAKLSASVLELPAPRAHRLCKQGEHRATKRVPPSLRVKSVAATRTGQLGERHDGEQRGLAAALRRPPTPPPVHRQAELVEAIPLVQHAHLVAREDHRLNGRRPVRHQQMLGRPRPHRRTQRRERAPRGAPSPALGSGRPPAVPSTFAAGTREIPRGRGGLYPSSPGYFRYRSFRSSGGFRDLPVTACP